MGVLANPIAALAASVITWFSFKASRSGDPRVSVPIAASAQGGLLQELQAAFEERDSRIRELEAATGGAHVGPSLVGWRGPLLAMARSRLVGSKASPAGQCRAEWGNESRAPSACMPGPDALAALFDAHAGLATLFLDSLQDLSEWVEEQAGAKFLTHLRGRVALAVPDAAPALPAGAAAWSRAAGASLSASYMKLQVAAGALVRSMADRYPQHRETLKARDPVQLVVKLAGFVVLLFWEAYGVWRIALAVARRAFFCRRRQTQGPSEKGAVVDGAKKASAPAGGHEAASDAAAAEHTATSGSVEGKELELVHRLPLQEAEADKENCDENSLHYM